MPLRIWRLKITSESQTVKLLIHYIDKQIIIPLRLHLLIYLMALRQKEFQEMCVEESESRVCSGCYSLRRNLNLPKEDLTLQVLCLGHGGQKHTSFVLRLIPLST